MSDQLSFDDALRFDAQEAQRKAQEGMDKADRAFRVQVWKTAAALWLLRLEPGTEFTADSLIADIGLPDVGVNRVNVIGAWFSGQAKRGLIEWTGRFSKSERVTRHGNLQRIWRKV